VGYVVIGDLLGGQLVLKTAILLFVVKIIVWIFSLASGTSGGVLAPLLIFGCSIGLVESSWLPGNVPAGAWALVGMGAIMGGMMRSPLTAIMFCFELTRDSEILLPLLIASVCSYAFTVWGMKRSILTEKVARRGFDIFREYSVDPLERFAVMSVVSATSLTQQMDLSKLPIVFSEETCRVAADRMAVHDTAHLLVISREDDKVLGVVTLIDLLKARKFHSEEESARETLFPFFSRSSS
jgi:CBS domain-containing protein